MRYGLRVGDDGTHSAEEVMALTRAAGFGPEVKRRIMIGTYALSAGYYDAYYNQAQKVRTLIARDLDEAYQKVDVLVSPATPTTAFPLGEKVDDPLAMYLFDLCTLPLNLAGHCGMSVPSGLSPDDNLPVGLQIMAPALADDRLYRVGAAYEAARGPLPTARRDGGGSGSGRESRRVMRIGILTGGGDCPGLNAVIRAVVRTCDVRYGSSVVGFLDGWRGLLEDRRIQLRQRRPQRPAAGQGRHHARHRAGAPRQAARRARPDQADARRQRHRRAHPDRRRGHADRRALAVGGERPRGRRAQDDRQRHRLHRRDIRPRHRAAASPPRPSTGCTAPPSRISG